MRITVEYAAQVKRVAGVGAEEFDLELPCTPKRLLSRVVERHGHSLKELLLDEAGSPRKALLFFVGDQQVRPELDVELRDGDTVTIMTPISGG